MGKPTLNSAMIDALTICQALDNAAQMLTQSDDTSWAAWMRHFLEALEQRAPSNGAYEAFLERLGNDLTTRLERGQW